MKTFKRHKALGFWDNDLRLSKISKLGDPLERLNNGVDLSKILSSELSNKFFIKMSSKIDERNIEGF
jgi:hypothetical protein